MAGEGTEPQLELVGVINYLPSRIWAIGQYKQEQDCEKDAQRWTSVYLCGLVTQGHEKATYDLGGELINFHCGLTSSMSFLIERGRYLDVWRHTWLSQIWRSPLASTGYRG